MKKLRKYLEIPKVRKERKAKEFKFAIYRTVFSAISGVAAIIGLLLSTLIFLKVYLHV